MKMAVFLERDGILTVPKIVEGSQVPPLTMDEFHINKDAIGLFDGLKAAGFLLIVTSNQPGLSDGSLSRRDLESMNAALRDAFPIDDILICPHDADDSCGCRKPLIGLFLEARRKWKIETGTSFVVSDKQQDAIASHELGCTSLMLDSPWLCNERCDFTLNTLDAIVKKILHLQRQH